MDSLNCFGCKVWHDADLLVYYPDEGLYRCYECAYKHEKKRIAALEARLKEAEEVIKPFAYWSQYLFSNDTEVTMEIRATDLRRAAAFLKGGDTI